jgi:nitrite reductase/ring-hydroxylating ferredoxin subunit
MVARGSEALGYRAVSKLHGSERVLCPLQDLADGQARGFMPVNREDRLFAVRRGEVVHVYLNSCPHNWRPLDFAQDRFLSADGREIVCYAHGAHFAIESGICTAGVCQGESLIAVPVRIQDGMILIPLELPATPE